MGTKRIPGAFDCYAKAHPDEPLFTLRGNDRLAPLVVDLWADAYALNTDHDPDKATEARSCADAMRKWYANNNPGAEVQS